MIEGMEQSISPRRKEHFPNAYHIKGGVAYLALTDKAGLVVARVQVDVQDLRPALFSRRWRLNGRVGSPNRQVIGSHYSKEEYKKTKSLARMLMGAQRGQIVRHLNGNKLDCRRENLELIACRSSRAAVV